MKIFFRVHASFSSLPSRLAAAPALPGALAAAAGAGSGGGSRLRQRRRNTCLASMCHTQTRPTTLVGRQSHKESWPRNAL